MSAYPSFWRDGETLLFFGSLQVVNQYIGLASGAYLLVSRREEEGCLSLSVAALRPDTGQGVFVVVAMVEADFPLLFAFRIRMNGIDVSVATSCAVSVALRHCFEERCRSEPVVF